MEDVTKINVEEVNKVTITTMQDAQDAAKKMVGEDEESKEQRKGIFDIVAEQMQIAAPDLGGMKELGVLLNLPEEHFNILAPVFLEELDKSFRQSDEKIALIQVMNSGGVRVDEMIEFYDEVAEQLDDQLSEILTPIKIDFVKRMLATVINSLADCEGVLKRVIQIPYESVSDEAKKPTYAHVTDAGMDVYSTEDYTINPGETVLVKTGIKVAIPKGYELQVRPKSGISLKSKLRVANTPGTIDSGYRDEIGIIIENVEPPIKSIQSEYDEHGKLFIKSIEYGKPYYIEKGQKIAQLVLNEIVTANLFKVTNIREVEGDRGGGFGSTGLV